jgi:hypothetical protein
MNLSTQKKIGLAIGITFTVIVVGLLVFHLVREADKGPGLHTGDNNEFGLVGEQLHWPSFPISVGYLPGTEQSVVDACNAAVETINQEWSAEPFEWVAEIQAPLKRGVTLHSGSDITGFFGAQLEDHYVWDLETGPSSGVPGVADLYWDVETGEIWNVRVILDPEWTDYSKDRWAEGLCQHELLHSLGLGHLIFAAPTTSVMYSTLTQGAMSLTDKDVAALDEIYDWNEE